MYTVDNGNETGSLLVGKTIDKLHVGSQVKIGDKTYTVSYLMKSKNPDKNRICAKGCGPFPMGTISFEIVGEDKPLQLVQQA